MPYIIPTSQSDIAEVRDQLSIDYADGKYLNAVIANLGLQRPTSGFDDATWRALGRVVALQHKQVTTKFEQILSIILGPKVTQCGALAQDVTAGDLYAVLVSTDQFPQVGTMVLDEGLATEETVRYTFIDRQTNVVYFETALSFDHTAVATEWETGVISPVAAGASYLNVYDANGFPNSSYTICIGRGTPYEFSAPILGLDLDARKLQVSFPPLGASGASSVAGIQRYQDGGPSQLNAHYLTLLDVENMSSVDGYLQSADLSTTLTATAGTTTSVTVAGPLTEDRYGGFWIRFNGDVTAALANVVAYVQDNTSTVFTLGNVLGAAPVAGDTFTLLANFQYHRVNAEDNSVLMRRELPDLMTFPANCEFTVMRPTTTIAIAQVQVKGAGWDVFQSDPHHVEILLPSDLFTNDVRTASYIRETGLSGSTTANATRAINLTNISVTDATLMPLCGTLDHAGTARYTYYNPYTTLTEDAPAGSTTLHVVSTAQFLPTGSVSVGGAFAVTYTVLDETTLTVSATPAAARITDVVRDRYILRLSKGLLNPVAIADAITFFANYDSGDTWNTEDVWPGPYVWDLSAHALKKETTPGNTATDTFAGPTVLSVDRVATATVLEVDDASSFPTAVPYNVLVGENSGNAETLAVQQVSLRSRTYEVTTALVNIGDTTVTLTDVSGPVGPLNQFPNGGPYRVVIEPFTANREVLEVSSTDGVNVLNLSTPATLSHAVGSRVVLLSDLLRITAAGDDHTGKVQYTDRLGLYAAERNTTPDLVRPLYTQATLSLGGTDFSAEEAYAFFNFGNAVTKAQSRIASAVSAGATTAVLTSTADFPTTGYPYVVVVDVGAGPLREEHLHVTNNNTGTNTLTFSHATVFNHEVARLVEFRPGAEETIGYTSRVGAVLNFDPYLMIEDTHYEMESLAPTVSTGHPRRDGYDFPLRLPVTAEDKLRYVIDLVRAAGIEVTFITSR